MEQANVTMLDHKSMAERDRRTLAAETDALAKRLDQQHPLERKVKFLLDVRGYIKVNALAGAYIEFGSYRSQMQYAAWRVLEPAGMMRHYIGLDTFTGEPTLTDADAAGPGFNAEGDFACDFESVRDFVQQSIGEKGRLIRGDFREAAVINRCQPFAPFNVAVIDCNLPSSIHAALDFALPRMAPGGVVFLDDYFADVTEGRLRVADMFAAALQRAGRYAVAHGFYPPFARSFVIVDHPPESRCVSGEHL